MAQSPPSTAMPFVQTVLGQTLRQVGAQVVAALFAAISNNLGLLHIPPLYVPFLGLLLHSIEEGLTKQLTSRSTTGP